MNPLIETRISRQRPILVDQILRQIVFNATYGYQGVNKS